jgi:hypothetical protein
MKKTFKFIMALVITSSTLFYSCETIELEQIDNPNALTTGDVDLLLNSIQLAYRDNMATHNNFGGNLTRISYFGGRDYFAGLTGGSLNGNWTRLYSNILINTKEIEKVAAASPEVNLSFHLGASKAMSAHALLLMVDYIGDIPLSEAVNPEEFPDPTLDPGASVYTAAVSLLDDAAALMQVEGAALPPGLGVDVYYGGDTSKWLKMINTVKMKAALTTGDIATFNTIVSGGNFISSSDDDLVFQYGSQLLLPNTQHPDYFADYTPSGANRYQSNWLMNQMQETNDPRLRYYFYRQASCTPGASCQPEGNGETMSCSLETPPVHYTTGGYTYCFLENGYWGRDHGDDDGTPPDNFFRTASGVYPAGGLFDDDTFGGVGLGLGGAGAGIEPILLASYVDFMRAEAALSGGNPGAAAGFLQSGLEKSIAKVQSFGALDANHDSSFEPDATDVSDFIADRVADFNTSTGDDRWDVLAQQYWVTMYGGGAEAYNFYRRTGYPTTLQPNLEPDPGGFPRSFPYATGAVNANPNIAQKPNQAVQVFWDNNPPSSASGGFPVAN